MVCLSLVLNALRTQAATLRARSAMVLTWGLQDRSVETITPRSLTVLVGLLLVLIITCQWPGTNLHFTAHGLIITCQWPNLHVNLP